MNPGEIWDQCFSTSRAVPGKAPPLLKGWFHHWRKCQRLKWKVYMWPFPTLLSSFGIVVFFTAFINKEMQVDLETDSMVFYPTRLLRSHLSNDIVIEEFHKKGCQIAGIGSSNSESSWQKRPKIKYSFCPKFSLVAYEHRRVNLKEVPPKEKPCIFGHCPNCDLTPPIAQIRALCGTIFLPKMRKFLKQ